MTAAPTTPREILIAARALIATPERWTKECYARDTTGNPWAREEDAVCWCAEGAVLRAGGDHDFQTYVALTRLENVVGGHVPTWQDAPERTHAQVLAAFDRAIAATGEVG